VKPIGPLMIEHRLIERMVNLLRNELHRARTSREPDIDLILQGIDFFRTYADRTHHGKEEDILFRDLAKKSMDDDLKRTMDRLTEDHRIARAHVKGLLESSLSYRSGNKEALEAILDHMDHLVDLYPRHIELEDSHFFYPCQDLFSKEESERMLNEFWEFDRKMIHEKYSQIVSTRESKE